METKTTWGDFEIDFDHEIGSGGMGTVYRARQISLNRQVAVKVVDFDKAPDEETREEFLRGYRNEIRALSEIRDPRVLSIIQAGLAGSLPWFAMDLLQGENLEERLRRGRVPESEAIRIAREIAMALEAARTRGILHRDVKPANIFLGRDESVTLLDWGLAEPGPTHLPGELISCTPAYTAPEYIRGEEIDWRSDLYSLGAVLYEMVAGRPPFPAACPLEVFSGHCTGKVRFRGTGRRLTRILRRCLEKRPGDRYATLQDFIRELEPRPTRGLFRAVGTTIASIILASPTILPTSTSEGAFFGRPVPASGSAAEAYPLPIFDSAAGTREAVVSAGKKSPPENPIRARPRSRPR